MTDLVALNRQVAGTIERGLGARQLLEKQLAAAESRQSNALEETELLEHVVALLAALQDTWKERFQTAIGQIVSEGLEGVFGEKLEMVCLGRDASVSMADGSRRQIWELVRDRDVGPVMTIDGNGRVAYKPITAWHQNRRGKRRWIGLRRQTGWTRVGRPILWATDDHLILTPDGWQSAGLMESGALVVTDEPDPSFEQWQVITGTLLGDAHLARRSSKARPVLRLQQGIKQREWLALKRRGLAGLGWSDIKPTHSGRAVLTYTKSQACFWDTHERWYGTGQKRVDRDAVSRFFGPLLLASWYLDDGSLRSDNGCIRFSTEGFPDEDVTWLSELLVEHGYRSWLVKSWHGHYQLLMRREASTRILMEIAKFVPPSMRYKLGNRLVDAYQPQAWDLPGPTRFVDQVTIDNRPHRIQKVYCIDVEDTHLFFAGGIAVHNCELGQSGDRPTARFAVRDSRGLETEIMDARGGGLVNIVSFLLRVLVLLSARPAMRRLLVLDESFNNVSAEFLDPLITLLRRICDDGNFQVVLVSHRPELAEAADVAYRFTLVDGVTRVEKIRSREDAIAEGGSDV